MKKIFLCLLIMGLTSNCVYADCRALLRPLAIGERADLNAGMFSVITALPPDMASSLRRLYREKKNVILIANTDDCYGVNSGRYNDEQIVKLLNQSMVPLDILRNILDSKYIRNSRDLVLNLKVLVERLPANYAQLSQVERKKAIEECLDNVRVRVQGTDGWRGDKIKNENAHLIIQLSPENIKEYVYAYVSSLIERGEMAVGDNFVIGYDPRDPEGVYIQAAIEGARLAGATVVDVDICSTPCTPLYMLHIGAKGAMVITASHNPGSQIGSKLFLAFQGLKLFPEDDFALSARFFRVHNLGLPASIPPAAGLTNKAIEAQQFLKQIHLDPRNTWAMDEKGRVISNILAGCSIVLDCAKGALSTKRIKQTGAPVRDGLAVTVLKELGADVEEVTADEGDGMVNHKSGPGKLEGYANAPITYDMVTLPGSPIHDYPALKRLFQKGRAIKSELIAGKKRLMAVLIDADGDRLFVLHYDPFNDNIIVQSGDETARLQGELLLSSDKTPFLNSSGTPAYAKAKYVGTVERDICAGFGEDFEEVYTGVGDKWVLLQAALAWADASIKIVSDKLQTQIKKGNLTRRLKTLSAEFDKMKTSPRVSSAWLKSLMDRLYRIRDETGLTQEELDQELCKPGVIRFAIGCEESGHNITLMIIPVMKDGKSVLKPVFFGNALKSATNTFVAIQRLFPMEVTTAGTAVEVYYEHMRHPFTPGHKKTLYAYYVDRYRLFRETPVWNEVASLIMEKTKEEFGDEDVRIREKVKPDEPNMLYFVLERKQEQEWVQFAALFVRNSGTEPKTSIYGRGPQAYKQALDRIVAKARDYLTIHMKDESNPYARAEAMLLRQIDQSTDKELSVLNLKTTIEAESDLISQGVVFTTLIEQLMDKEHVITVTREDGQEFCTLTERGRWYLANIVNKPAALTSAGVVGPVDARRDLNAQAALAQSILRQMPALDRSLEIRYPDVHFVSPGCVTIRGNPKIGAGTVVYPDVIIDGDDAVIGENCELLPGTVVSHSTVENGATLEKTTVESGSTVEADAKLIFAKVAGKSRVGARTKAIGAKLDNSTTGEECDLWFGCEAVNCTLGNNVTVGSKLNGVTIGDGVVTEHAGSNLKGAEFPNKYLRTDAAGNIIRDEPIIIPNATNIGAGTEIDGKAILYTVFTGINTQITGPVTCHLGAFLKGVIHAERVNGEVLPFSFVEGIVQSDGTIRLEHRIGYTIDPDSQKGAVGILKTFIQNTMALLPAGQQDDVYEAIRSALRFGLRWVNEELAKLASGGTSIYTQRQLEDGRRLYEQALGDESIWQLSASQRPKPKQAAAVSPAAPRAPKTIAQFEREQKRYISAHWPGVKFDDPESTIIDTTVGIDPGATVGPNTIILGKSRIGRCSISNSRVVDYRIEEDAKVKGAILVHDTSVSESFAFVSNPQNPSEHALGQFKVKNTDGVVGENAVIKDTHLLNTTVGNNTAITNSNIKHSIVGEDNKIDHNQWRMSQSGPKCQFDNAELTRAWCGTGATVGAVGGKVVYIANISPDVIPGPWGTVLAGIPCVVHYPAGFECANYSGILGKAKGQGFVFPCAIEPGTKLLLKYGHPDVTIADLPFQNQFPNDLTVILPFCHIGGQVWGILPPGTIKIGEELSPKTQKIGAVFEEEPEVVMDIINEIIAKLPEGEKNRADTLIEDMLKLGIQMVVDELAKLDRGERSFYDRAQLERGLEIYLQHLHSRIWEMKDGKFVVNKEQKREWKQDAATGRWSNEALAIHREACANAIKVAPAFSADFVRAISPANCIVARLSTGNINNTYLFIERGTGKRAIVQEVNTEIFNTAAELHNAPLFQEVQATARAQGILPAYWENVTTEFYTEQTTGNIFRAINFIDGVIADSYEDLQRKLKAKYGKDVTIEEIAMVHGEGIAIFDAMLNCTPKNWKSILRGFHKFMYHTAYRRAILKGRRVARSLKKGASLRTVRPDDQNGVQIDRDMLREKYGAYYQRRIDALAGKLDSPKRKAIMAEMRKSIGTGIQHGDTKINNFIFRIIDGRVRCVAVVDHDTIQPGSIMDDIGDTLRSSLTTKGEQIPLNQVEISPTVAVNIATGYIRKLRELPSIYPPEQVAIIQRHIIMSAKLFLKELSERFFADALISIKDRYFSKDRDLLLMAEVQEKTLELLEEMEGQIQQDLDAALGIPAAAVLPAAPAPAEAPAPLTAALIAI